MAKANVEKSQNLKAKHLRIYFTYTFLFTRINVEKLYTKISSEQNFLSLLNKTSNRYIRAYIHWAGGEPIINGLAQTEKRVSYLDPFLHLKVPHIHFTLPIEEVQLKHNGKEIGRTPSEVTKARAILNSEMIILDSGWGRLMLILDVFPDKTRLLGKETVIEISNVGLRQQPLISEDKTNNAMCKVKIIDGQSNERFLFDAFWEKVSMVKKDLNNILSPCKISWIEVDENLVGREVCVSKKTGEPLTHFQNPFPIIVLEVPEEQYALNFLDKEQIVNFLGSKDKLANWTDRKRKNFQTTYIKELLSILFRSKESQFPDFTFANKFVGIIDGRLLNMCSTCSIFFHLYSRSCLVISPDLGIDKKYNIGHEPASYLIPCLVSTVSSLRCRWHAYATLGKWLDKVIGDLGNDVKDVEKSLKEVIHIRRGVARSLVDPITYRAGSGSLSKLYMIGVSTFRIEELQQIIVEKFATLDRLFGNLYERLRIREVQEIKKEMRKTELGNG